MSALVSGPSKRPAVELDVRPPGIDQFHSAVLDGLRQDPKSIPSKFLYDETGSRLFDEITLLDEYYPTRTELRLLEKHARDIARMAGAGITLVEFGSGSGLKIRLLLDELDRPRAYVPIDIARGHLLTASRALAHDYSGLSVLPIHADFTRPIELPRLGPGRRIGFFPGSTIGNFTPEEAVGFLHAAGESLGPGSGMVIGVDLKKDPGVLHAAYNDRDGVTAAFNLNLLARINRELGGSFDLARFRHRAVYARDKGRIEMHLESRVEQSVMVAGRSFRFAAGETIHTENSYKYTREGFVALAASGGWDAAACWTDPDELFSVHFLRRPR